MRLSKAEAKYLRSLQQKKIRNREKKFVIEGWRALGEALHAAAAIEYVALATADLAEGWAELLRDLQRLGVPVKETDDATLAKRVERDVESGRRGSVNATPTFFIDGARYANSRNVEGLRGLIFDAAMRNTERLLKER